MIIEQLTRQMEGTGKKLPFLPPLCINRDLISDMDCMISLQQLMTMLWLEQNIIETKG